MSKGSQMITFTFQNGCVATLRTSGTEPKIKYYAEMCALPGHRSVPQQGTRRGLSICCSRLLSQTQFPSYSELKLLR